MQSETLKPCPFCGGEAKLRTYETESLWSHDQVTYTQVGCEECDYHIATEPGYEMEAPERWNNRTPTPPAESAGLVDRDARTMTDPARMLWQDDVEGICPSIDMCFEYGEHVRCGPCAIKQADACGVTPDQSTPNLPEVYRLNRVVAAQDAEIARLHGRLRDAVNDAVSTLAAIRAASAGDEWHLSSQHFHDLCGETIARLNALATPETGHD